MPIILVARRANRLQALAEELRINERVETLVVPLDLTRPNATEELASAIGSRHVSVLVNNAGFGLSSPFHLQDPMLLADMVMVNCLAPTLMTRHFLPAMIDKRNGAILTVSSFVGWLSIPFLACYSATKAFDLFLGESLYYELKPLGIDSCVLCPGSTQTEFRSVAGTAKKNEGPMPDVVAETGLKAVGRRAVVMHGFMNTLLANLATRLLSRAGRSRIAARMSWELTEPNAAAHYAKQCGKVS